MKIIILESDNDKRYKAVIHFGVPAGNNAVGKGWRECALATNMIGTTVLEIGTAPGNITQTEYDSIVSGDTIEIIRHINPGLDPSNAAVIGACDVRVTEYQNDLARILKYYGHTIGA